MKPRLMRHFRIASLLLLMLAPLAARGQEREDIIIDYNNPRKYVVAGIAVEETKLAALEDIMARFGEEEGK